MGWFQTYQVQMPKNGLGIESILEKFKLQETCGISYSITPKHNFLHSIQEIKKIIQIKRLNFCTDSFPENITMEKSIDYNSKTADYLLQLMKWARDELKGNFSIFFSSVDDPMQTGKSIHIGYFVNGPPNLGDSFPQLKNKPSLSTSFGFYSQNKSEAIEEHRNYLTKLKIPFEIYEDPKTELVWIKSVPNNQILFQDFYIFPGCSSNTFYFLDLSLEELFNRILQSKPFEPKNVHVHLGDIPLTKIEKILNAKNIIGNDFGLEFSAMHHFSTPEALAFLNENNKLQGKFELSIPVTLKLKWEDEARPQDLDFTIENGKLEVQYRISKGECDVDQVKREIGLELEWLNCG